MSAEGTCTKTDFFYGSFYDSYLTLKHHKIESLLKTNKILLWQLVKERRKKRMNERRKK